MIAGGSKGLREVVTTAIESNDLSALVRLVFEPAAARDAAPSPGQDPQSPQRASAATEAGAERLATVVRALREAAARKEAEVGRACAANAADIAAALRQVAPLQQSAAELRQQVHDKEVALQRLGAAFAAKTEDLHAAQVADARAAEARAAVAAAVAALEQCAEAAKCLEAGQLHRAQGLLQRLRRAHGGALRWARDASIAARSAQAQARLLSAAEAEAAAAPAAQLGSLAGVLLDQMSCLEQAVDQQAIADLNGWLVEARAAARGIGAAAMRAVEQERAARAKLGVSRAAVVRQLQEGRGAAADEAAALLAARATPASPAAADPLAGLDMTPLLRCLHVHVGCGRLPRLLELYTASRQAQLGADLAPPGDVLGCHAAYLAAMVGFFLIEDRVAALAPALNSGAHAAAAWEGASAAVGAVLGAALDECAAPPAAVAVARGGAAACAAVDACGREDFPTAGVRAALRARSGRLATALAEAAAPALLDAGVHGGKLAAVVRRWARPALMKHLRWVMRALAPMLCVPWCYCPGHSC